MKIPSLEARDAMGGAPKARRELVRRGALEFSRVSRFDYDAFCCIPLGRPTIEPRWTHGKDGRMKMMAWRKAGGAPPRKPANGLMARRALYGSLPGVLGFTGRKTGKVYGRIGSLEVRLASSRADIKRAQRLRYNVFYEEMSATPTLTAKVRRRDEDAYDAICDHLLVVDTANHALGAWTGRQQPNVVGTYRVLRQSMAKRRLGFYTQGEYDIAPLIAAKSPRYRFMELGRSCVLKPYRNKRTVELLWHGLWTYIREHKVDVMIGCASFDGADPERHAMALSFLYHNALAPPEWRCRAHERLYVPMNRMAKEALDARAALKAMPPLIKGYLRLGAYVGDGAVIDRQFGTTDVLIILPVEKIDPRYFEHFGAPDEVGSRVAAGG